MNLSFLRSRFRCEASFSFAPGVPAGVTLLFAWLLLAPAATRAQSPAPQPTAETDLPASPGAFLLDALRLEREAAFLRHEAREAARLTAEEARIARASQASSRDGSGPRARRHAPDGNARFPSWNVPTQTGGRGMFYASTGYGVISNEFDADGEMRTPGRDLTFEASLREAAALVEGLDPSAIPEVITGTVSAPARLAGEVRSFNLNVGGAFEVYSSSAFNLALGADFQAAQQNFETDGLTVNVAEGEGSVPGLGIQGVPLSAIVAQINPDAVVPESVEIRPEESERVPAAVEGGFQAQALTLFAQASRRLFSVRGGFQFDLGNAPDAANFEREVSDRQNAILLGTTVNYPASERFRAYGGVDGWFTLENEENDLVYDEGNSYAAQVGGEYRIIPSMALGAALTYRYRTSGSLDLAETEEATPGIETESGYHFGIAPYVNYAPPSLPLTLYLKGGVRDEYRDFSFSLVGENEFAPRAGATFGAVYRL